MTRIEGRTLARLITAVRRRLWWARATTVLGRGVLCAGVVLLLAGIAHRMLAPWSSAVAAAAGTLPLLIALLVLLVSRRPDAIAAALAADRALGSKGLLLAAVDQSTVAREQRAGAAALVLARAEHLAGSSPLPDFRAPADRSRDRITFTLAVALALAGAVMLGGTAAVMQAAPAVPSMRAAIPTRAPPGPVARAQRSLAPISDPSRTGLAEPFFTQSADPRLRPDPDTRDAGKPGAFAVPAPANRDPGTASAPLATPAPADAPRIGRSESPATEGGRAGDDAGTGTRLKTTPTGALPPERDWRHRDLAGDGSADTVVAGGDARTTFAVRRPDDAAVAPARPVGGTPLNSLTPGVRAYAESYLMLLGNNR